MFANDPAHLVVNDLGRMPYAQALVLQRQVHQRVLDALVPQTLLLVEHDPVITVSQRNSTAKHLLANANRLAEMGIDVQRTDRGGDVTYHGPGQLVAYPILRLGGLGIHVGRYMRLLEQIVIDTVAAFGILGVREEGLTGVWTGVDRSEPGRRAKLCAMGIRVRRNVTLHGLALNVTTRLEHFDTIVPCGLIGRDVTSLRQLLGDRTPEMDQVKQRLVASMCRRLGELAHPSGPLCAPNMHSSSI